MQKKYLSLLFPGLALLMELLPQGVVLYFGNPEGEPFVQHFSYFSLTPYGYANFGPFLTAVTTCILLLTTLYVIIRSRKLTLCRNLSFLATLFSLMPLLYGWKYLTVPGILISLSLGINTFLLHRLGRAPATH